MAIKHHIVIGSGVTGNQAAETLRQNDPDSKVSIITTARLPFYNRYHLPSVIRGIKDWREFVIYPPEFYRDNKINLRRFQTVDSINVTNKTLTLKHKERIKYDNIIIAAGARAFIPPELSEFKNLFQYFHLFSEVQATMKALPKGGMVIILGGDINGIDFGRAFLESGYKVTIISGPQTFLPHLIPIEKHQKYLNALKNMNFEVVETKQVSEIISIDSGNKSGRQRIVTFSDGRTLEGDIIMPFFGRQPMIDFIANTGMDIERGILVKPDLRSTVEGIYAAGEICQIWTESEKAYKFYSGWKNLKAMGELAAKNVTGGKKLWQPVSDEKLKVDKNGYLNSPYWEHP